MAETRADCLPSSPDKIINLPNNHNETQLAAVLFDTLGSCDFRATFTVLSFLNEEYVKVSSPNDTPEQIFKHVGQAINKLRTIADGGCKLSDQHDIALRTTLSDHARNFLNALAQGELEHQEASLLLASCVNKPALIALMAHCEDFWSDSLKVLKVRQLLVHVLDLQLDLQIVVSGPEEILTFQDGLKDFKVTPPLQGPGICESECFRSGVLGGIGGGLALAGIAGGVYGIYKLYQRYSHPNTPGDGGNTCQPSDTKHKLKLDKLTPKQEVQHQSSTISSHH